MCRPPQNASLDTVAADLFAVALLAGRLDLAQQVAAAAADALNAERALLAGSPASGRVRLALAVAETQPA